MYVFIYFFLVVDTAGLNNLRIQPDSHSWMKFHPSSGDLVTEQA